MVAEFKSTLKTIGVGMPALRAADSKRASWTVRWFRIEESIWGRR